MFKGIDISTYQKPKNIDYDKLSKEIDFAILRVGYTGWGNGVSKNDDAEFKAHYKALSSRNIPIGVYWYSVANTPEKARSEAQATLERIKGLKIEYPVYWDTEDTHYQKRTSRQTLTDTAKAFCDEIEKAGYYVGIYASASWLKQKLDMNQLKAYDVWVAHYGVDKPNYDLPYGMWQFTSKGRLNGYGGDLDLNIAYKDYKKIITDAGLNNLEKPVVVPKPKPEPTPNNEIRLGDAVVVSGSLYATSSMGGKGKTLKEHKGKITIINEGSRAPYHIDNLGWVIKKSVNVESVNETVYYTVQKGDSLWSIAKKYNTTWQKIYADNKKIIGDDKDVIKVGMKLIIK